MVNSEKFWTSGELDLDESLRREERFSSEESRPSSIWNRHQEKFCKFWLLPLFLPFTAIYCLLLSSAIALW